MAKIIPRPQLSLLEQLYFVEVFKGMALTIKHAVRSLAKPETIPVLNYPEVQPELPAEHRSEHRLMKRADGTSRCVACYMCQTACPARCITIVAEESPDGDIEKRPATFDIDWLLCVFCGLCVEACPCDAIRMDTGKAILVEDSRDAFIANKDRLMDWSPADYPAEDIISQEAPGGLLNEQALAAMQGGMFSAGDVADVADKETC